MEVAPLILTRSHRAWLAIIIGLYLLLALTYMLVVPLYEASDELWHYPMAQYLAENGWRLPPQDPENPGPWRQEGSQPPLYYMMGALLIAGIDTSDLNQVRRINPHADIGTLPPDGNVNMMVHSGEAYPLRGAKLATYVLRLLSIALSVGTILVTFATARELFPQQPIYALGAAALNAFLPMFIFISATVNNDNLSNLLANLLVLLLLRLVGRKTAPNWRTYALIGLVTGTGILAKLNIGFLIPVVAFSLLLISWRQRDWQPLVIGGAVSGGLTILIAGWWYWHNWTLYGDPTGLTRFLDMVGRRSVPADLAQIWAERDSFTQAYWGFFGGVNVPLPAPLYDLLNVIGLMALVSALFFLLMRFIRREWPLEKWWVVGIAVLWPLMTFISYLRWTSETFASQGRLIFGALSVLSLWMVVGLAWWLPDRYRPVMLTGIAALFFGIAASAPFTAIAPAYALPAQVTPDGDPVATFREPDASNPGRIAVHEPHLLTEQARPGDYVHLELTFVVEERLTQDWSLFVHLVSPQGVIIGQRDVYPGQGRLATSDLAVGRAWDNPIAVKVPVNAYTPITVDVRLGWYHLPTETRLRRDNSSEMLELGSVELLPPVSELNIPNPVSVNFDGQIELAGYEISELAPQAGDTITLTLYWRAQRDLDTDYTVFANIIDPTTLTKYAASNAMPVNWTRPTSSWEPGAIVVDAHQLNIAADAVPGIYEIEVGLYTRDEAGTFNRLKVVRTNRNFVYLTRVRLLP